MRILSLLFLIFQFLFLPATGKNAVAAALAETDKVNVIVSIAPQKYFVERIGRDQVQVTVLVKTGADPHSYEPSPAQMVAASGSSLYFTAGLGMELAWVPRIKEVSGGLKVVSLAEDSDLDDEHDEADHDQEDNGHGHEHAGHLHGDDGHAWLSPVHVKKMVPLITLALIAENPAKADFFKANAQAFLTEIDLLDLEIRALLRDIPQNRRQFMTFHPAWRNFAEDYGLREIAIESDGKEPGPRRMAELIDLARADNITVIFVEPQFPQRTARAIADTIPAKVLVIDPLAENWSDNLRTTAGLFAGSLK